MRVVSFKIDEDLLAHLESYSRSKRTTKSEVIRTAIRFYLEQVAKDQKPYVTRRVRVY